MQMEIVAKCKDVTDCVLKWLCCHRLTEVMCYFSYVFRPYYESWNQLRQSGAMIGLSDIAEISNLTKEPVRLASMNINGNSTDVKIIDLLKAVARTGYEASLKKE